MNAMRMTYGTMRGLGRCRSFLFSTTVCYQGATVGNPLGGGKIHQKPIIIAYQNHKRGKDHYGFCLVILALFDFHICPEWVAFGHFLSLVLVSSQFNLYGLLLCTNFQGPIKIPLGNASVMITQAKFGIPRFATRQPNRARLSKGGPPLENIC